jgi:hypothetical protein
VLVLGYPSVSLSDARKAADTARRQIADGQDPVAARRTKRSAAPIPTFAEIAQEVIADEQDKSTNDKVKYQWTHLLGPKFCSLILKKPVNTITSSDVKRVLDPVWFEKPETARKLYRRLKRVFEHARVRLRDRHDVHMPDNPARWDDLRALGFQTTRKLSRGRHPSLLAATWTLGWPGRQRS